MMMMDGWSVCSTRAAKGAINPIRQCMEKHFVEPVKQSRKDLYKLALGDPPPHPAVLEAVHKALQSGNTFSYGLSYGYEPARRTIAQHYSTPDRPLSADDVLMTTGCAGALEAAYTVLCEPGTNVLIPSPCYGMYCCLAGAIGLNVKFYTLQADRSWEADLEDMDRQVDSNTRAIVLNNPSNPCGSVYSQEHLREIVGVARKHKLPIIADEVYNNMVFSGSVFCPVSSVCDGVPVLSCGSLSKRFLVPGWRVGWIVIHDKLGVFQSEVRGGLRNLATRNIGACGVIQAAIPDIFNNVPESFFAETNATFESNARACYERLNQVEGLRPVMPAGAMYMMVLLDLGRFPEFEDDITFNKQLIIEQGVICVPGSAFKGPIGMRIALILPEDELKVACDRIAEFCREHISYSQ